MPLPVWRDGSTLRPTSFRHRFAALSSLFVGRGYSVTRAGGNREGAYTHEFIAMLGGYILAGVDLTSRARNSV